MECGMSHVSFPTLKTRIHIGSSYTDLCGKLEQVQVDLEDVAADSLLAFVGGELHKG